MSMGISTEEMWILYTILFSGTLFEQSRLLRLNIFCHRAVWLNRWHQSYCSEARWECCIDVNGWL